MPKPEERARQEIDRLLTAAGWAVQDLGSANLGAAPGVAIREFQLLPGHGFADYGTAPADLLRLSVGHEHVADLIADVEQALAKAHGRAAGLRRPLGSHCRTGSPAAAPAATA